MRMGVWRGLSRKNLELKKTWLFSAVCLCVYCTAYVSVVLPKSVCVCLFSSFFILLYARVEKPKRAQNTFEVAAVVAVSFFRFFSFSFHFDREKMDESAVAVWFLVGLAG